MIKTVKVDDDKIKVGLCCHLESMIVLLAPNMGYCRSREVSVHHSELLSIRPCNRSCL